MNEYGLSVRQVREATGVGKTAVSEYVSRAKVIGITWPIPPKISDAELERPKTNDPSNDAANAQHGTQNTCWRFWGRYDVNLDSLPCLLAG